MNYQKWLLKIVLPLLVFGVLIYAILTHSPYFNGEIPVDNLNEPWPSQNTICPPKPTFDAGSSLKDAP